MIYLARLDGTAFGLRVHVLGPITVIPAQAGIHCRHEEALAR